MFPIPRLTLNGALAIAGVTLGLWPSGASANHAWKNLHWPSYGRGLAIVNQAGPQYDSFIRVTVEKWRRAVAPWATSSFPQGPLALRYEADGPPRCENPAKGEIMVCARSLTRPGGLAYVYADSAGHIRGATVYFDPRVPRNRLMNVLCHEVGHALSLNHRTGNRSCLGAGSDPDRHDGQQIALNHSHFD
jgi:hypothetical protein